MYCRFSDSEKQIINICYVVHKNFWPLNTMRNDKGRGSIESSGGHCESQCKSSVTLVQRWQVKINIKGLIEEGKSPRDRVIIPLALPRSVPYLALKVCSPGKHPQSQADQGGWSPYLEGQNVDWEGMIACLQY